MLVMDRQRLAGFARDVGWTSADVEQPSAGADPPAVFSRWTNVVFDRILPPEEPWSEPIAVSRRQAIEPVFGQLASDPAWMAFFFGSSTAAQTLLLSNELCQVALPKGSGLGALSLGFASRLRKWVMIWICFPKNVVKSVASGRALLAFQAAVLAPALVGRQI